MSQKSFKVPFITLLVILLTGCSPSTPAKVTSTPAKVTSIPVNVTGTPITFDIADLHIQSDYGIQCYNHEAWQAGKERANLVLADSHRLKYDGPELRQMMNYVTAYYTGSLYGMDVPNPKPLPVLPSTLSYKWGGNKLGFSNLGWIGCFEEIALTNIGNHPIQIQSINVRFTATPQPNNSEQYSLIDVCSLLLSPIKEEGCPGGKGGGAINYYYYQLSSANADHTFSPRIMGGDYPLPGNLKSTTYILNPRDKEVIDLAFDSSLPSVIYSIIPELIVGTSKGQRSIPMPQLIGKLYFANLSQFSCYTLQGNTFVKEANLPNSSWVGSKGMCI